MDEQIQRIVDGRTDLIIPLVKNGGDPGKPDSTGTSLFKWAAYYGDVTAIQFLLTKGMTLDELGDNFDLNGAAFHGHWQLCQFLLENGADPNYPLPETGEVPLHAALCKANSPPSRMIVELLLGHGADPNRKTVSGGETGGFMRDVRTRGETPLHRAAAFADAETISMLLHAGARKEVKDVYGESPLTWASWHLRPGKILGLLAYENHRIHPLHEQRMLSDHGSGWGGGMYLNLLGKVHLHTTDKSN